MYIKLTRLTKAPIWINAAFIVTIEPRKGGGSLVVPVGDGLDYDVLESPEEVLSLLGDAPVPAVVPIPTSDALTAPSVEDIAESNSLPAEEPPEVKPAAESVASEGEEKKTEKKPRKTSTAKKPRAVRKKKPELPLGPEQLERLKKMMPKSAQKLQNTLKTQFNITDPEAAMKALEANEVLELDEGDHVTWK